MDLDLGSRVWFLSTALPSPSQSGRSRTPACVAKQHNLVTVERRWCSEARKVRNRRFGVALVMCHVSCYYRIIDDDCEMETMKWNDGAGTCRQRALSPTIDQSVLFSSSAPSGRSVWSTCCRVCCFRCSAAIAATTSSRCTSLSSCCTSATLSVSCTCSTRCWAPPITRTASTSSTLWWTELTGPRHQCFRVSLSAISKYVVI